MQPWAQGVCDDNDAWKTSQKLTSPPFERYDLWAQNRQGGYSWWCYWGHCAACQDVDEYIITMEPFERGTAQPGKPGWAAWEITTHVAYTVTTLIKRIAVWTYTSPICVGKVVAPCYNREHEIGTSNDVPQLLWAASADIPRLWGMPYSQWCPRRHLPAWIEGGL